MIDDNSSTVFLHSQMLTRRRDRFGQTGGQSIGSHLSSLSRDYFLSQSGRIIIDGHGSGRRGHCCRIVRLGRRVAWRRLGPRHERIGHVDGHFPMRSRVVTRPVAASFAAVTGAATADTPAARSATAPCHSQHNSENSNEHTWPKTTSKKFEFD